jgi:perosamine synthetase
MGWNYRMTNLQAALGVAQLERVDEFALRKRQMGGFYSAAFQDLPGIRLPLARTGYAENIYWVYGIVLENGIDFDAAEAMKRLAGRGIGTRPFFWGMHEQPVFRRMGLFAGESYPVAEHLARRGFYIPSGLGMTDGQMAEAAENVRQVLSAQG